MILKLNWKSRVTKSPSAKDRLTCNFPLYEKSVFAWFAKINYDHFRGVFFIQLENLTGG